MSKITIKLWNKNIGTLERLNDGRYVFETQDDSVQISPLKYRLIAEQKQIFETLPYVFEDSLPGGYGRSLYQKLLKDIECADNELNMLLLVGSRGMGALEYSPSLIDANIDAQSRVMTLSDVYNNSKNAEIQMNIKEAINYIIEVGSAGGMRKKAKLSFNPKNSMFKYTENINPNDDFIPSIVKLSEVDAKFNARDVKIEYIWNQLANFIGLKTSRNWLIADENNNYALVLERFDIDTNGSRIHMQSLSALNGVDFYKKHFDYDDLFRTAKLLKCPNDSFEYIYRQMIFNYVYSVKDDHGKNFSFLMNKDGEWIASPAYDLTYTAARDHHMTFLDKTGNNVSIKEFQAFAKTYGVKNYEEIIYEVESGLIYLIELFSKYYKQDSDTSVYLEDIRLITKDSQFKNIKPSEIWSIAKGL